MFKLQRRVLLLAGLALAASFSYVSAFLLRFEFILPVSVRDLFRLGLWTFLPYKMLMYWLCRVHTGSWRRPSMPEVFHLVVANGAASILACITTVCIAGAAFPRSIYVLDAALCLLLTLSIQVAARVYWELATQRVPESGYSKAILIYGAGAGGSILAREIRSNPRLRTRILGFLDDDGTKRGTSLDGIRVYGTGSETRRIVRRFAQARTPVSEIIIAMPSATSKQMRAAIARCRVAGVGFRTLPSMSELLTRNIAQQIRDVSPNDLLGREPVTVDESSIRGAIVGESVLVTGGCGSIGSELCRQIAPLGPRRLVILDQAESDIYMLSLELRSRYPHLELAGEIGDILSAARVKEVMSRHAVTVVFHAAAYKHVPLMEQHVGEALSNNVLGTYNVVRAAYGQAVKRFVLISSDKAVNPTSIMGATKRAAELIVSAMPLDGGPKTGAFVSVRFGNVLGSSGSVIPIFQRQIRAGGPVTVTHPDMRRYFMSIFEAVQLVLQASSIGKGSEVFVLDMGEPVRITDLAKNMIRLAGLLPGEDIEIQFTGLRPGEKLFEELQCSGEAILPTSHRKINRFCAEPPNAQTIARWLESLRILLPSGDPESLKEHLRLLVPEYQAPTNPAEQGRTALRGRAS